MAYQQNSYRTSLSSADVASGKGLGRWLTTALVCTLIAACNGSGSGFSGIYKASKSSNPAKTDSDVPSTLSSYDVEVTAAEGSSISSETLQKNFEIIQSPGFFEAFSNLSTKDYLVSRIAAATNDIYEVGGYQFSGIEGILSRYEEQALELAATYPTMGEYYASLGIYSAADLRLENAASNLQRLAVLVQNGEFEDQESPKDTEDFDATNAGGDANAVFALERPWCEKDHIWDIPIYKEHCHPDGGSLGNETCTPAVYREHGHRCNEPPRGMPGPFPGGGSAG